MDYRNPIVLDYETYYSQRDKYGLKTMTTEEYLRDPRYQCIGLSIEAPGQEVKYYPGESWIKELKRLIAKHPESPVVAHNAMFDGAIMGLLYGIHPKYLLCTQDMARVAGMHYVTKHNSLSLDAISEFLKGQGVAIESKGTFVHNMDGVRLEEMTEKMTKSYSSYCETDTKNCGIAYHYLLDSGLVPECELHSISMTKQMYCNPVFELDADLLEDYLKRLLAARSHSMRQVMDIFGYDSEEVALTAIRSRSKFPKMLEALDVEVPMKWSEKQEKMVPAMAKDDEGLQALLEHPNREVRFLVDTKIGASSSQELSRTQTFLEIASRGKLPVPLGYAYARTLRYGGMDKINLQNLRKRTGEPIHRRSIIAPKGSMILTTDSSQIEARLLAYGAGQNDLVQLFLTGQCPYSDMAGVIYNVDPAQLYADHKAGVKAATKMRNVGKEVVLGCGYQMGESRFEREMRNKGMDEAADMAGRIIGTYRNKNPMIVKFWGTCEQVLRIMLNGGSCGFGGPNNDLFFADGSSVFFGKTIPSIRLPNGTHLFFHNLRVEPGEYGEQYVYDISAEKRRGLEKAYLYGGKLTENLMQAWAFCILKYQANNIVASGVGVHMNVHDEWASVVERAKAAEAIFIHARCMRNVPDYIPQGLLNCEVDVGVNYADSRTAPV